MTHGDPIFDKALAEFLEKKLDAEKRKALITPMTIVWVRDDYFLLFDEADKRFIGFLLVPAASLDIGYQMRVIEALGYQWRRGEMFYTLWTGGDSYCFHSAPSLLDALRYIIKEEK